MIIKHSEMMYCVEICGLTQKQLADWIKKSYELLNKLKGKTIQRLDYFNNDTNNMTYLVAIPIEFKDELNKIIEKYNKLE